MGYTDVHYAVKDAYSFTGVLITIAFFTFVAILFVPVTIIVLLVWLTVSRSFAAPLVVLGWGVALTGVGLSFPMLSVLTLQLSAPEEQGANSSALQLSAALFSSAALALAGLLYLPETEPFAAVLAVSLGVALLALALGPRAYR
mgnify:CR=1 FL=1